MKNEKRKMQIENVKEIAGVGWDETAGWDESDESHRLDLVGGTRTARPTQQLNRRDLLCAVVASAAAATFPADARLAGAEEAGAVSLQAFEKAKVQEFAWGWIRWLMNAQIDPKAEMTLGVVYVQPNQSNPLHVHPNSAEYLHMLSGSCEHRVGGRWVSLKTGRYAADSPRCGPHGPHQGRSVPRPGRLRHRHAADGPCDGSQAAPVLVLLC